MKVFAKVDEAWFRSKIEKYVGAQLKKGLRAGMTALTLAAESASLPHVPKVTGNLASSVTHRIEGEGWDVVGLLRATASYAKFVHEGTGIYGPRGTPIRYMRHPSALHAVRWRGKLTAKAGRSAKTLRAQGFKKVRAITKNVGWSHKQVVGYTAEKSTSSGWGGTEGTFEVNWPGMKGRPFFEYGLRAIAPRAADIVLSAFFRAVDKPK